MSVPPQSCKHQKCVCKTHTTDKPHKGHTTKLPTHHRNASTKGTQPNYLITTEKNKNKKTCTAENDLCTCITRKDLYKGTPQKEPKAHHKHTFANIKHTPLKDFRKELTTERRLQRTYYRMTYAKDILQKDIC